MVDIGKIRQTLPVTRPAKVELKPLQKNKQASEQPPSNTADNDVADDDDGIEHIDEYA